MCAILADFFHFILYISPLPVSTPYSLSPIHISDDRSGRERPAQSARRRSSGLQQQLVLSLSAGETFSCPAPQPTSSNQVSTLSASIAAMRMTAPCLAAALGVGLAWAAMRMGDPAAVPFQTSRESADWLTEEPRTNSTEPSPGTAGLTTDASTFIRRVNASNISLGWKPDGNPAKLWLTLSQPPERRRRAAVAGKVKRLIIEAGGPSLIARIELEWASGSRTIRSRRGHQPGPRGLASQAVVGSIFPR